LRGNLRDVLQGVVEQMRLLDLAQIFRVDTKQHIDVVVFNGVVDTIDPRIGMETKYMNEDPRGAVRRSAEGALLVCEFRGDELGWKLVPSESEGCVFLGDPA
jgi:hypothetical protein